MATLLVVLEVAITLLKKLNRNRGLVTHDNPQTLVASGFMYKPFSFYWEGDMHPLMDERLVHVAERDVNINGVLSGWAVMLAHLAG